jgi:hypothetical protein
VPAWSLGSGGSSGRSIDALISSAESIFSRGGASWLDPVWLDPAPFPPRPAGGAAGAPWRGSALVSLSPLKTTAG